jgi:hypothetical protein
MVAAVFLIASGLAQNSSSAPRDYTAEVHTRDRDGDGGVTYEC